MKADSLAPYIPANRECVCDVYDLCVFVAYYVACMRFVVFIHIYTHTSCCSIWRAMCFECFEVCFCSFHSCLVCVAVSTAFVRYIPYSAKTQEPHTEINGQLWCSLLFSFIFCHQLCFVTFFCYCCLKYFFFYLFPMLISKYYCYGWQPITGLICWSFCFVAVWRVSHMKQLMEKRIITIRVGFEYASSFRFITDVPTRMRIGIASKTFYVALQSVSLWTNDEYEQEMASSTQTTKLLIFCHCEWHLP